MIFKLYNTNKGKYTIHTFDFSNLDAASLTSQESNIKQNKFLKI